MRPGAWRTNVLARGEERGVRAAVAERHAEALRVAERRRPRPSRPAASAAPAPADPWRRRRARRPRAPASMIGRRSTHPAALVRVLQPAAPKTSRRRSACPSSGADLRCRCRAARRARAGRRWSAGSTRSLTRNAAPPARRLRRRLHAVQQRHRFGGGRGLVEQRRVGDLHPGQVADHRLEVEQRLEPALRDLRLIRRVGRVPARVLHHHPQDHAGRDGVVVARGRCRSGTPGCARPAAPGARRN